MKNSRTSLKTLKKQTKLLVLNNIQILETVSTLRTTKKTIRKTDGRKIQIGTTETITGVNQRTGTMIMAVIIITNSTYSLTA